MKLATFDSAGRDGELWLVSRDMSRTVSATDIAGTLLTALENWETVAPRLEALYQSLNEGDARSAVAFDPARCLAPLPRAPQWLDSSSFLNHGRRMDQAFGISAGPDVATIPLVYQGASDDFRGARVNVEFPDEALDIDMEGEFGVLLSDVSLGVGAEQAQSKIRLLVQINDWSLRRLAPREMKTGFGWIQAKPTTSFAPLAVTPEEIGPHWADGRVKLPLHVSVNGRRIGHPNGAEMHFSFGEIIAHCARTRRLSAGTIIGSGTVSSVDRAAGSTCLSEVRVIEMLDQGAAQTPFLRFGDRVGMAAVLPDGTTPFGVIDQQVVRAS